MRASSDIHEDRWLIGELHFFDAKDRSVHLIVDPGKIGDSGSLSHSAELVIYGAVAQAHPTLIRAQVRHWNATQVSANS